MIHVSSSPSSRGISRIGISVCPGQLSGITAVLHNNRAQDCEEEEDEVAPVMRKKMNIGTMKWKKVEKGNWAPKSKSFPVCGKAWMETILQMYFNHISQGRSFCAVESASGVKNNQLTQPLRPNLNGRPIWYCICISSTVSW